MPLTRRKFLYSSTLAAGLALSVKHQALASAIKRVGLAELYEADFFVGTALNANVFEQDRSELLKLVKQEFNAITAENAMKWGPLNPEPGVFHWDVPDQMVAFGVANGMYIVGHTLVWHSQAPEWLFTTDEGGEVDRKTLLTRMDRHIETLVGRYKGKIPCWDVVNEAVDEDKGWRKSPWFNIIGPDYMEHAFRKTHEVDPKAHLIYNDYNMHLPAKRKFLFNVLEDFVKRDVPIHGVGLQGHIGLDYPDLSEFEDTIKACADLGLAAHVTELDIDVLPVAWEHTGANISDMKEYSEELDPYTQGLPKKVVQEQADRYVQLFELCLKHRKTVKRISLWGVGDDDSWKNDFPVAGRTNYPLLFDRDYEPKAAYEALRQLKKS